MQLDNEAIGGVVRKIASERGVHAASMDSLKNASLSSRIALGKCVVKRRERRAPILHQLHRSGFRVSARDCHNSGTP